MIRLMCKSRTRNIRRMIFSLMTALAIMVQALSYSFQVDATASSDYHYLGGTIVWTQNSWSPITIELTADSFNPDDNSSSSDYAAQNISHIGSFTSSLGAGSVGQHIYLNQSVPSGSWVYGSLYLLLRFSDISDITFLSCEVSLNQPVGVDSFSASITPYDFNSPSDRLCFIFNFRFHTDLELDSIDFDHLQINYSGNASSSGVMRFQILRQTRLYYILDSDYADDSMLSEIEQNTDTIIDGYDNSQITNDNQQLSDAMQDYDNSQAAAVGDSTGYIDDVSFFDPSSSAQVMSGITLTGSFLQSLFENLGQWGAVVMVSLSLTFGLMLVGWFKFRK